MCRCEMCNRAAVISWVRGQTPNRTRCLTGRLRQPWGVPLHTRTCTVLVLGTAPGGALNPRAGRSAAGGTRSRDPATAQPAAPEAVSAGSAEWRYHSKQAGTTRKGDQPKNWTGRRFLFNTVGTYEFVLDFGGYVSEVVRGSGTMVWGLGISVLDGVGMVCRVPTFLFRSSPSLSSSVYFFSSRPKAALGAEHSCGTVPSRSTVAGRVSVKFRVATELREPSAVFPHRFLEDFPLSPSFQVTKLRIRFLGSQGSVAVAEQILSSPRPSTSSVARWILFDAFVLLWELRFRVVGDSLRLGRYCKFSAWSR